jgi:hypothetical protein
MRDTADPAKNRAAGSTTPSAASESIERLSKKFGKWLVNQKEWPLILGMSRADRRRFAREFSRRLTSLNQ